MTILFICTSNKDRSPALQNYFKEVYPQHEYRSAGVNRYFTSKKGTHYLTQEDIDWANIIVYAEKVHWQVTHKLFPENVIKYKGELVLELGNYQQGCINDDYLMNAEIKLEKYLKDTI